MARDETTLSLFLRDPLGIPNYCLTKISSRYQVIDATLEKKQTSVTTNFGHYINAHLQSLLCTEAFSSLICLCTST